MVIEERTCIDCNGKFLLCSEYFSFKNGYFSNRCIRCSKDRESEYKAAKYRESPEVYKGRAKSYRQRNPLQVRACRLKREFGVDLDWYDATVVLQGGVCAICRRKDEARSLSVDHCHSSGVLRGLLCRTCNLMLGSAKDDPAILESAKLYLMKHTALEDVPLG